VIVATSTLKKRFGKIVRGHAAWPAAPMGRTEPGTTYIAMVFGTCDQTKIQEGIIIVAGSAITKDETSSRLLSRRHQCRCPCQRGKVHSLLRRAGLQSR
jgi:hypothetical protein